MEQQLFTLLKHREADRRKTRSKSNAAEYTMEMAYEQQVMQKNKK